MRNTIIVRERYLVHRLWKDGSWTYVPRFIEEHLARPDTLIRSMPLAVDFPLNITERITFRGAARMKGDAVILDTPALRFEQHFSGDGITYSLRSKKDAVAVKEVADHIAALNDIDDGIAFTFEAQRAPLWPWAAGFALVVLLVTTATFLAVRGTRTPDRNSLPITIVGVDSATTQKEIQGHA